MGKAGRKRKVGVKRYPNGTPHRHEDARAVVIKARMRRYGYTKTRATEQWAGYEIGRMALAGHFGPDFEAQKALNTVEDYVKAAVAYLRLKSPQYPLPKAMDYLAGRGTSLVGDPSEARVRSIEEYYQTLIDRLTKGVAASDRIAFHEIAFHDRPCGTDRIQAVINCVKALRSG